MFFYSSPDIISTMKQKSVRWAGHVARKGDFGIPQKFRESRKKQASWKDTFHIKMSSGLRMCTGFKWLRTGFNGGIFLNMGMKFVASYKGCNYFIN